MSLEYFVLKMDCAHGALLLTLKYLDVLRKSICEIWVKAEFAPHVRKIFTWKDYGQTNYDYSDLCIWWAAIFMETNEVSLFSP